MVGSEGSCLAAEDVGEFASVIGREEHRVAGQRKAHGKRFERPGHGGKRAILALPRRNGRPHVAAQHSGKERSRVAVEYHRVARDHFARGQPHALRATVADDDLTAAAS